MTVLKIWLEACLSPIGFMVLLLAGGFLMIVIRRNSKLGLRLLMSGGALCLTFLLTPVAEVLNAGLEHQYPPLLRASPSVRNVVVLVGYGEDYPGLPITSRLNQEAVSRAAEGIRLYRQVPGARLILSGGTAPWQSRPSAVITADFAKAMGVPEGDILLELQSRSTYENFVELKKMIGAEPFMLVTSSDHLKRAVAVARRLEMNPIPASAGVWASRYFPAGMSWLEWAWKFVRHSGYPRPHRFSYLQRASREHLGYFWYWASGRI